MDFPPPISPLHRSTPPTRADAGAFSYFFVPPFNPPVPIHAAAPTQAPELALCFTRQLAPVVAGEGAPSAAVELSYHHIDHDRNPLPHGKHRVAVSAGVSVGDPASPEQVHLAFADAVDEMRVLFVCGDRGERVVRYGLQKEDEKEWKEVGTYVSKYEQKHMCDWPANSSVAWKDPGFVFDGLMKGLEPGRKYFYKVP